MAFKDRGFTLYVDTQRATPIVIFALLIAAAAVAFTLAVGAVQ